MAFVGYRTLRIGALDPQIRQSAKLAVHSKRTFIELLGSMVSLWLPIRPKSCGMELKGQNASLS